jgi:hypothetical protein
MALAAGTLAGFNMAQQQMDDSDYGVPDPNQLLSEQQASYAQEMARSSNASNRNIVAGIGGLQNFNAGGPQMQEAQIVQSRMREILQQTNADAPEDEDPLTKQMRIAQAMATGLAQVSPSAAMKAQDQVVRLAQAKQQQALLTTKQQEEQQTLQQETMKTNLMKNTPQTIVLAQDQGKDSNGMPMGYTQYKSYDATDPNAMAQMRADQQAASTNGLQVTPMTLKDLIDNKQQIAITRGQAQVQAAMIAAQSRLQAAQEKTGSNSVTDRMTNRIMTAADMSSTQLSNIASMNFGVSRGFFGLNASAGTGLMDMTKNNIYNALTTEDQQMYNAMAANLYRPLSLLETGGGLQGGQQLSAQIKQALTISPTDSPMTVLTKLAEARQIIDTGSEAYMSAKNIDAGVKAQVQSRIDALHQAVPWTPADVIAYKKSLEANPQLTFAQFSKSLNIPGASAAQQQKAQAGLTSPQATSKDANGVAYTESF